MLKRLCVSVFLLAPLACSRSTTAPSTPGIDLSGTWVGSTSDAKGTRQFRYDLTQIGTEVTGLITIQKPTDIFPLLGTVNGSMSASKFTFNWKIPGNCSLFGPSCDLLANGSATVSGASMSGSYNCSANCTDLVSSGSVSVTRQ